MQKIKFATVSLHISSALYILIGLGSFIVAPLILIVPEEYTELDPDANIFFIFVAIISGLFSLALAAFIEVVVYYLKKKKFWAWVAAIIIAGIYIPSIYMPLGIIALIGLLSQETQDCFRKK